MKKISIFQGATLTNSTIKLGNIRIGSANIPDDLLEDFTPEEKNNLVNALDTEEIEIGENIEISSDSTIEVNGKKISEEAKNTSCSLSKMHFLSHVISDLDRNLLKKAEALLNEAYPEDHKDHHHEGVKARRAYIEQAKGHPLSEKEKKKLTSFIQELERIVKIKYRTQKTL